jgi:Yip1-like protein
MTEPATAMGAEVAPAKSSLFEDIIDVFFNPSAVFRRRADKSPWPAIITCAVLSAVIAIATYNALAPVFDAEFARSSAKAIKANPQVTQEMMDKTRGFATTTAKYGSIIIVPIVIFVLGVVAWLVSKLVGAKETFNAAVVVVAYAFFVRILGNILMGVQGLLMDPSKITGLGSVSLSPARFMNPDTASAMSLAMAGRLDLFILWSTVLIAIGIYATGKVSKGKAVVFGVLLWFVGSIPALIGGLRG